MSSTSSQMPLGKERALVTTMPLGKERALVTATLQTVFTPSNLFLIRLVERYCLTSYLVSYHDALLS